MNRDAAILIRFRSGETLHSIGSRFGLTRQRVEQIVRGHCRHVLRVRELKSLLGCKVSAARRVARKHGFRRAGEKCSYVVPPERLEACRASLRRFCRACGAELVEPKSAQKYCGAECRRSR